MDMDLNGIALYAGLVALMNGLAGLNINPPAGKSIRPKAEVGGDPWRHAQ